MDTKKCTKCNKWKPKRQFTKRPERLHGKGYRSHCKQCRNETQKAKMAKDTSFEQILNHYGNHCACCGETIKQFLSIDHIKGGGNKHRKKIKNKGGKKFYAWLIKNKFPKDYQILCMNCNWGKRMNRGICPHKDTCDPII